MSSNLSLRNPFDRNNPPMGLFLLIISIVIGFGTGLACVLFIKLIFAIQGFFYDDLTRYIPNLGNWIYLIAPAVGSLLVGPIFLVASEAKGHGVPEVMAALITRGGKIRARVAISKILASSLCIGTGGSAGREGPIIQIGSALGSTIGQVLRLSDERVRNLVACGAAAGVAATFNAPITGIVFAVEVLMSGLELRYFGNVVISAVSASVVSRGILGNQPAFKVPVYTVNSMTEIFLYLALGLISAVVGVLFIKLLELSENTFDRWKFPNILKPAAGGILVGILGFAYMHFPNLPFPRPGLHTGGLTVPLPHIYGEGFSVIEEAINGGLGVWLLLALTILKPIATSMTLGSGNSGGVFAPTLFTGAMLGGVVGHLFAYCFPQMNLQVEAFALVGMAAVFSASAHAPLTSMLIVFEMSGDYSLILPLMVAGVTASYFSQYLQPESIYTIKLAKRGIHFFEGRDMDIMQGVHVSEVMRSHPVSINKNASFSELMTLLQETNLHGFPVLDGDKLWGMVTLNDVHHATQLDNFFPDKIKVSDIASHDPITMYPDEPISLAIQKMSPRDLARLPVIPRDGSDILLGLISRSDILRAYDVGVVRKRRGQLDEKQVQLKKPKETGFVEFVIKDEDNCSKATIKHLTIPETVNMVSIQRGGQMIIPRPETKLQSGDVITVYGKLNDIAGLKDLLNSCTLPETK